MEFNSLLAIVISVLIVTVGVYLCVQALTRALTERKQWEHRLVRQQVITPLRLQAYERMCLFLERVSPNNLIVRVAGSATTASEFHQLLLREIREEFNHNLAQQIYIGPDTWEIIRNAKEEVVTIINLAAQEVPGEAPTGELARRIIKLVIEKETLAVSTALDTLKREIQAIF